MPSVLCGEELIVYGNRRKSAVAKGIDGWKSSLSPFFGMQGVGEKGVPFRELSTQRSLLRTELP